MYLSIGLLYYLILNIVPIDNLIAKNQVDRYFADRKQGIEYIMTLSPDAAPQISRLLDSGKVDDQTRQMARMYFPTSMPDTRLENGAGRDTTVN